MIEKKKDPLVSVIMATYNETPHILEESIKSILEQSYKNIELLIFDDSTNANTKKTIDFFAEDERIRVFRGSQRIGFVQSLNQGLKEAKGKYIARMDGDDFSYKTRIEKEVKFLENNIDVDVIGGQIEIINEKGNVISHRRYPVSKIGIYLYSCFRNPLAHPSIMMRRKIVDEGYFYNEKLKMSEDLDLWLRLINNGYSIRNIKDIVLKYRVQSNFIDKRTSYKQRIYMESVRKSNFNKKHLLHGILSCCAGWLFTHIPVKCLEKLYNKENSRRISLEKI